jgi:transposase-like protein
MGRIPASERTRERLKALMDGQSEEGDLRSALVRLAARLIVEEGLEGEATDALGREYYARGAAAGAGYRNGYRRGRLKTAEGVVEYAAPQICDRAVPFRSRLREIIRGRTEELEALAVEMYARGLSTRDIEALFADEDGRSLLSRTAVSEVTERLWAQYEAFASRDLSEFEVIYLFVDGIAERLHLGQPREAVLAAWGVLADGHRVLLHLAPGSKEDTASCREFFQDMRRRGLPDPLLVISDGAPGLIRAIEECFPRSARQRCLAHKLRNLQSEGPEDQWPEFKARAIACYQAASPALARMLRDDIAATYGAALPSALACLQDDFEACIAHLSDFFDRDDDCGNRCTSILLFGRAAGHSSVPAIDLAAAARRGSQGWPHLRPPQGSALTAPSTAARWRGTGLHSWRGWNFPSAAIMVVRRG